MKLDIANNPSRPQPQPKVLSKCPAWVTAAIERNYKQYGTPPDKLIRQLDALGQGKRKSAGEDEEDRMESTLVDMRKRKVIALSHSVQGEEEGELIEPESSNHAASRTPMQQDIVAEKSRAPDESSRQPTGPKNDYTPLPLPQWYKELTRASYGMKGLAKRPSSDQSSALTALSSMKGCIKRCKEASPKLSEALFEELRDQIHKAEILLKVDRFIVRKAQMLHPDFGLPRIFESTAFPWDIKADAWQLYNRWYNEVFDIDLLRGIMSKKKDFRNADSIHPKWKRRSAKEYGEMDLILGQWWPTQLCAVRDGAHGAAQAGIWGEKGKGAYSIVLSSGSGYKDEDHGDAIWYSGTDGSDYKMTEATMRMVESCSLHNDIRVLRSSQLPKSNRFRPEFGIRYDGLYKCVEKKMVNPSTASYKFRLERCPGQHSIRCEDNGARRPTRYEIDVYRKLCEIGRC